MTATVELRKTSAPPLLRLPPAIRHQIYRLLGLVSWNGYPYNFELNGPGPQVFWNTWSWEQHSTSDFHGLLLSCRHLHAETATLLYSANRFVLRYANPGSLQPLFALSRTALTSLAELKVVLNQTSCHHPVQKYDYEDCCLYKSGWSLTAVISTCEQRYHSHHHQLPLLGPVPEGDSDLSDTVQALLSEWHAAANHLSSYLTPKRLELSLVCDIDPRHEKAVELAKSALKPLSLLPLLRSCHIRLCKTTDSRLRQLAQDAALQSTVHDFTILTPWSVPEIPFSYMYNSTSETAKMEYPYERLAASQFLRQVIPGHCIAQLRFLELVFPPYRPYTWPETDHPVMRDWRETVAWLRDMINGPALTLRLIAIRYTSDSDFEGPITVAEGDKVHRAYMDLLEPLKALAEGANGISKFYASLRHPWELTFENENRRTGMEDFFEDSWLQAEERALKQRAERHVMGDRYESLYANGRKEPPQSLWHHVLKRHV
ncbi:predicted protein [Chaetomium globosum CBS 148.51]|uniref:Uncharacterized protein n=1 Tax=Chaetomium globosum (strain ATCC 6205 / CBS 148.51 / DSM 1962 / NBRC 6347 / NRRL 1970) TaxID=306901 RepID=Q2GTU1_CHAGB|nr:uncharacterized protein CHGG_08613 [Chaetomium globosum CBS 148.51]EAQ84599.1 predicted protein [Chaetomium globosum CBS 148.51]